MIVRLPQPHETISPINLFLFFKLTSLRYVFINSMRMNLCSKLVPVEWCAAIRIPENVEVTLELGNRQRLKQFRGLRRRQENVGKFGTSLRLEGSEDWKMWESLELPRDLLNGFDQNANNDIDNEIQAEMVSDGDEKLIEN